MLHVRRTSDKPLSSWESKGPTPPLSRFPQEIAGVIKKLLTTHRRVPLNSHDFRDAMVENP